MFFWTQFSLKLKCLIFFVACILFGFLLKLLFSSKSERGIRKSSNLPISKISKQKLLPPGKSQHGPILCHLSRTYPCYRPTLAILSMAALSLWYLPKPFTDFRLTGTSWCPQSRSNSSCRFFGSVSKLIITCNLLKLSTYIILVSEITRNCQSRLYSIFFILFYFVLIRKNCEKMREFVM